MKSASILMVLLCATALVAPGQDTSDSATKSKIVALEGAWNQAYKSGDAKALDALLDKGAQQDLGTAERKATYEEVQTKIMDLAPFVGVMSQVRIEASAAKLHDLHMGPDGLNATQMNDVWLDA